ncbi:MAG: phage tail fiber protein [Methylocystis sp.]|uniref:phage tail fiber protein n=1 Tax=Methylocystis sp. TaxID=1911079 RepID=UPI003DA1E20B
MTTDVSGFGAQVQIKASNTFPQGFVVSQFADDADPFDIPSVQIADKAMGLNGDLITWSKANPIMITINVVPGSEDDKNLAILLEANRVGKGKSGARDEITVVAVYPNEGTLTLSAGIITDGSPGNSIASAGRLKSKAYQFAFENKTDTRG